MEIFNLIGLVFNTLFFAPIVNLMVAIYKALEFINFPGALGLAIVLLTVVIRLIIWPLFSTQIKSSKKMNELRPHLDVLKEKHKGDKQAFARAQMDLFHQHGVNPAAGCLPTIVQFPILIALYQAIINIFPGGAGLGGNLENINKALYHPALKLASTPDPNFFGFNLGVKPWDFGTHGVVLLLVPLVTAGLTFIQSKMMLPPKLQKQNKEKKEEDMMVTMQSQMLYLMPLMIGWFAATLPMGLSLYWNTLTIIGIIQQRKIK